MTALVFIDTETTGLDPGLDEIWEVAAIRREVDGSEEYHHFQVVHDIRQIQNLPEPFQTAYRERYDEAKALSYQEGAERLQTIFDGRTHLVAANPAFDAAFLAELIANGAGPAQPWNYHLIDVEAMALGYLAYPGLMPTLPFKSDDLSRLCGVEPPNRSERHTAQGDCAWVMRWFDKMAE